MLSVLTNVTYRRLFTAQVVALVGTGLMTVALALLAYDLAGENAGAVLGTALAIKMVAYVVVGLLAGGVANLVPRRAFLVSLDLVRAAVAVALPFVDQVWQIYVLIALLQSASAAFTPTFQATIPDILTRERDYTNALSLSRIAYDLENLLSPMLAAALVALVGYHWLHSRKATATAETVITERSPRASSTRGKARAASIDPPPKTASAMATSASPRPNVVRASTTVFTMIMAPAAATARLSAHTISKIC